MNVPHFFQLLRVFIFPNSFLIAFRLCKTKLPTSGPVNYINAFFYEATEHSSLKANIRLNARYVSSYAHMKSSKLEQ